MFEKRTTTQTVTKQIFVFEWDESERVKTKLRALSTDEKLNKNMLNFYFPGDHWVIVETRSECKAYWCDSRGRTSYLVVLEKRDGYWKSYTASPEDSYKLLAEG